MRLNTKDGKYQHIDPCTFFTKGFPPVFFIHGVEDRVVPVRFSERAYADLKGLGVVTELRLVDGKDHAFDEELGIEDAEFDTVREGLEFLAKYAQAGSMFQEA
jgi:dipeptidyl aminopeptidase/acylaminoacyl peptidase